MLYMTGQLLGAGLAGGVLRGAFGAERSIESVLTSLQYLGFDICCRFKGGGCFRDPGTVTVGQALLIETVSSLALLSVPSINVGRVTTKDLRAKCSCLWSSPRPSTTRIIWASSRAVCGWMFARIGKLCDGWIGARVYRGIDEPHKMLCFCHHEARLHR